ncbi:hypothetical protein EV182_000477 [Spiromyces aspiralis]|uniref:Uncharacterized protein n=1 Tax=Spiromyces aspiralis TaxID=68401 RepID=A0ACC1HX09_9FUNG|nr:hypothetical protein EV182_000477 [Spiromyces aspiralis]
MVSVSASTEDTQPLPPPADNPRAIGGNDTADDESQQRKPIGLGSGVGIVLNQLIGSGIFSTPAFVVWYCKTPTMALVLWTLGAAISIGGGLGFVELGMMYPTNGGMMRYLTEAYPRPSHLLGFTFAWTIILFVRPASIAAGSTVFARYLVYAMAGGSSMPERHPWVYEHRETVYLVFAVLGTTGVALLNWSSTKWSLWCTNAITVGKVALLLVIAATGLLVLLGVVETPESAVNGWARGFAGSSLNPHDYALALNKVFWAYEGWANLHYVAGEIHRPERNLPLSIGLGISGVSVLYILANIAYFSVVPIDDAITSGEILGARFTNMMFGTAVGEVLLPLCISLFVLSTNIIYMYSGYHLVIAAYEMGYATWVSKFLSVRTVTPTMSLLMLWVLSTFLLVVLPPGNLFNLLVDMIQYPMWFFYGFTVLGCLVLERRFGQTQQWPAFALIRRFRAPRVGCVAFAAVCLTLAVVQLWPPDSDGTSTPSDGNGGYPYYFVPVLGICFFVATCVPWYFSMVKGSLQPVASSPPLSPVPSRPEGRE